YMIVRQSDAHAWVEVYLEDEGWIRVDPTGAVAPDRIERGLAAIEGLEGRAGGALRSMQWFNQMRLRWDDINNRWNLFVLGYDQEKQRALVERLGIQNADYRTLVVLMFTLLALVISAITLWMFWQMRP